MAKAKQSDTLIVKGGGGAVWEVDDTPAIRDQINDGSLKLLRGPKTARKPAGETKPTEGEQTQSEDAGETQPTEGGGGEGQAD
jgi:hypothetical protein